VTDLNLVEVKKDCGRMNIDANSGTVPMSLGNIGQGRDGKGRHG